VKKTLNSVIVSDHRLLRFGSLSHSTAAMRSGLIRPSQHVTIFESLYYGALLIALHAFRTKPHIEFAPTSSLALSPPTSTWLLENAVRGLP
jgi:hypothetical protein